MKANTAHKQTQTKNIGTLKNDKDKTKQEKRE